MINRSEYKNAQIKAGDMIKSAGIVANDKDLENIEVADFGLSNLMVEGAQMLTLFETDKVSCRVIALFPNQTEPEHCHISKGDYEGKQETMRIISGELHLVLEGEPNIDDTFVPDGKLKEYIGRRDVVMKPCDTVTMEPGTKHWFKAGEAGCVFYVMSTTTTDEYDVWTDKDIVRKTIIKE